MGYLIFVLLIFIGVQNSHLAKKPNSKVSTFGPSCKYLLPFEFEDYRIYHAVPSEAVKFGNTAGIGLDMVYVDHEMLWNATHKRELHEN